MSSIVIYCSHCGPSSELWKVTHDPSTATVEQWKGYWKNLQSNLVNNRPLFHRDMTCSCGCQFDLLDDGVSVNSGGSVIAVDVSRPKIISLNVSNGSTTGGTAVIISGNSLDVGDLTVKFGNNEATINSRTPTSANVTTPAMEIGLDVVNVTVENQFGQRADGTSTLTDAFTYA